MRVLIQVFDALLVGLPEKTVAEAWRIVDMYQQKTKWVSSSDRDGIQVLYRKVVLLMLLLF